MRARSRSREKTERTACSGTDLGQRWSRICEAISEFEETSWTARSGSDGSGLRELVARRLKLLQEAGEALGYPPESWLYSATASQLEAAMPPSVLHISGQQEPCRMFSPRTSKGRSSADQNRHYSSENHIEMALDSTRVAAFQSCIQRVAASRRVLDVGSGAFCLLGRLALKAGAALVHCVEQSSASVAYSRELFQMEMAGVDLAPLQWLRRTPAALPADKMQLLLPSPSARRWEIHVEDVAVQERMVHDTECQDDRSDGSDSQHCSLRSTVLLWPDDAGEFPCSLELHEGLCAEIALPGGYDVVVHELLGYVASSEGVVPTIKDIHDRHILANECSFIPASAGTYFAPTARIELTELESALHQLFNGAERLAVKTKYNARHFDPSSFLASPEAFEWFQFGAAETLRDQERTVEFRTTREGYFDGLHFHLLIQMDPLTTVNVLTASTTWCTSYVRLLEEAVLLPAGSLIVCRCRAAASAATPEYSVQVWLGRPAEGSPPLALLASFAWEGCS